MVNDVRLNLLPNERWWGGAIRDGELMPFGNVPHQRDLRVDVLRNQASPLLVSSAGRYLWSEEPFAFSFGDGAVEVTGTDLVVAQDGTSLGSAFRHAAASFFPASGTIPAEQMFRFPQYNTWIEMPYRPTQQSVLAYARGLLDAGFPPGLMMIDDRWSRDYGEWEFDRGQFPDPTAMVAELHELGFTVMLWLMPVISADSPAYRQLSEHGLLVREPSGVPALREWWNGYSAMLDCTNPDAVSWIHGVLDGLREQHGLDGFKFDGGDFYMFTPDDVTFTPATVAGQCEAWGKVGLHYEFNEYRACWKLGGQPLAQRLHDKPPTWGEGGLASLVPEGIAQGLAGFAYICPDMIGGGLLGAFYDASFEFDTELMVRYGQCAALFPMMQFSVSPSRVLVGEQLDACRAAADLHVSLGAEIVELARQSSRTGEPILRSLAFDNPGDGTRGYEDVTDQFLLGTDILVAPVLEKGATARHVVLPPGIWRATDGTEFAGPDEITVPVTISTIPLFRRVT